MLNEIFSIVSDFGLSPKADNNVEWYPFILRKGARRIHVRFAEGKNKFNHHHLPLVCFREDKKFNFFEVHLF